MCSKVPKRSTWEAKLSCNVTYERIVSVDLLNDSILKVLMCTMKNDSKMLTPCPEWKRATHM